MKNSVSIIIATVGAVLIPIFPVFAEILCDPAAHCISETQCAETGGSCGADVDQCSGNNCCCLSGSSNKNIALYDPDKDLGDAFTSRGVSGGLTPGALLQKIAYYALYFLGAIITALLIYAGFEWALASGDKSKIAKARQTILYALIGMAIVLGAYGIAQLVFNTIIGG